MKKKKVYIAGPVTGVPGLNRESFENAAQTLRKNGYVPIIPLDFDFDEESIKYCEAYGKDSHHIYMRKCVEELAKCDHIALLPGWEHSKGASIERDLAVALKMVFLIISNDLESIIIKINN